MKNKITKYPEEYVHHRAESMRLDLIANGIPLRMDVRLLERYVSERRVAEAHEHPAPFFSRIFLFKQGGATLTVQGKSEALRPGIIYQLPSHQPFAIEYTPSTLYYFHLHVTDLSGASVFQSETRLHAIHDSQCFNAILAAQDAEDSLLVFSTLLPVLRQALQPHRPSIEERARRTQTFATLFKWLAEQRLATVTLSQAAALYQITPAAFSKRFKRVMGISFKNYLNTQQVERIKHELIYSHKSMTQISEEMGHRYPQYFQRFFKNNSPYTPAQFRQHSRDEPVEALTKPPGVERPLSIRG